MRAKGYRILETNYHTAFGELDLIAETKESLVFVEVKTRRSNRFGTPAEAVNYTKQQHMFKAAASYLSAHPTKKETRFDVIEVLAVMVGDTPSLNHIHHIENIVLEGVY